MSTRVYACDTFYRVSAQDSSLMASECFVEHRPARPAMGRGWRKAVRNERAKRYAWDYACGWAPKLQERYRPEVDVHYTRIVITRHEPDKEPVEVYRAYPGTEKWQAMMDAAQKIAG